MTTQTIDLDLGALSSPPVNIKDRAGKVWSCDSSLPLYTMFALYRLARKAAEQGGDTTSFGIEEVSEVVDGLHAIFAGVNASVTREDVERAFTLNEMLQVVSYLSSREEETDAPVTKEATPAPAAEAPATVTAGRRRTTTKTRPSSKK